MSPIGDAFKTRLRMFPALVNCCTIDWFLPWPKEALTSVAQYFLANVEDLAEREGIVDICVDMQERAMRLADLYRIELRRYYYVTPTSYLILIKTFTDLLRKRRDNVNTEIKKFERGLKQLGNAEVQVDGLKKNLEVLIPEVIKAAQESQIKQKEIEIEKKEVDRQRKIANEEAATAKIAKDKAMIIEQDCN
jgi:dynein heavy chain, axonemal